MIYTKCIGLTSYFSSGMVTHINLALLVFQDGRGFREIKALRKELKERERKVMKEILSNAQVILGELSLILF